MSSAERYLPHYTIDDLRRWEGDWELYDGIAVSMSPGPFGPHQTVAFRLGLELQNAFDAGGCDAKVVPELDWIVSEDTVVRPDLVVLCGEVPDQHLHETPVLVAEVLSESTEERDRTYKRDLYRSQGVTAYLLLDPTAQTLEAYVRTANGSYEHQQVSESIELKLCDNCEVHLHRSKLFQR